LKKQAVILAGGKGRRLMPFTRHIPKPLILLKNKPFIYYIIKQLEYFEVEEILIICAYKNFKFKDFIKKYINNFKIKIKLIIQPENWLTAKRIYKIKEKINNQFYLLYGDNLVNLKKKNFKKFRANSIVVQNHLYSKEIGNVKLQNKKIVFYEEIRNKNLNYVELGYFYLKKKDIIPLLNNQNESFSKILTKMVNKRKIKSFETKSTYLSITNIKNLKRSERLIKKFQYLHLS
jgi:glucose-1-phosphate cytidylyltransferase